MKSPPARRGKRGYLKIAHRGASASEPEDTLRAFKEAVGLGADMIEVDVRLSKDGLPVIIHDASLERTTKGTGYVRDKTLLELKELDAGQGERIPTLQEAIDFARGKCGLYIELKDQATPGPVVETIRANGFEGEAIICSFDHALLRQVKELAPEIPTSVLVGETSGDFVEIARAAGADLHTLLLGRTITDPPQAAYPRTGGKDTRTRLGYHHLA